MDQINDILKDGLQAGKHKINTIPVDWVKHTSAVMEIAFMLCPKKENQKDSGFKITDNNRGVLKLLLLYFTGNKDFETYCKQITGMPGSLDKGIMLNGGVGAGKTLLFDIFKHYTKYILSTNSFQQFTCLEIIDNTNISGPAYLEQFSFRDGKPITCYFDDIASKNETIKHYGTEMNVIEQLLSLRYNVYQRHGTLTHCTSNKFGKELMDLYDKRVVDRIKEMFNIIELSGKSFRK